MTREIEEPEINSNYCKLGEVEIGGENVEDKDKDL